MTVTISRLYDTYAAALEAVRQLEAAGVSHGNNQHRFQQFG